MYLVGMGIAVFLEYALGMALVDLVLWYTHHE
jgi:hypothetical protein